MPRVSVILTTYNRRALLAQALASVAAQTVRDYELIVVDDGSTDGSRELLAGHDLTLIPLAHGGWPERARNAGLAVARGELVAFLDDDDLWVPDYLEKQLAHFARDPRVGLTYCDARFLYPDGTLSAPRLAHRHRDATRLLDHLLGGWSLYPSLLIFRRALLARTGPIDEWLPTQGDHAFLLRLAYRTRAACTPEPLATIRRDPQGLSRRRDLLHFATAARVLEDFEARHRLGPRQRLYARRTRARLEAHLGRALRRLGAPARARRRLVRSIRLWPFQRAAYSWLFGRA